MPTTNEVPPEPKLDPNISAILEMVGHNGSIPNAEKAQQEGMSALGKIYQKIEKDLHGNRAAVRDIRKMQKMSADKRADYIRTLEPLMVELGYTLDVIDPQDLVASQKKVAEDAPAATPGGNSDKSVLDAAREKLGAAEPGAEPALREVSVQLKKYLTLRRGGESQKDAAETAGIAIEEAEMHDKADAAGEYSHVKGPTKAKPVLGIVPPSGKPN